MRMKKFLAFGLIALLFAVVMSVAPTQSVPVDKDVGICYVAPMDQTADVVMYVADNNTPSLPDSRSSVLSGVEKSDYTITLNSIIDVLCLNDDSHYDTPANQMTNPQGINNKVREFGGLGTGEDYSQVGVATRHKT
jgi:hypothetical protein